MTVLERITKGLPVNVGPLAEQAGIAPATIYRAISRGEIEVIRIGTRVTIPARVAQRLLQLPSASVGS